MFLTWNLHGLRAFYFVVAPVISSLRACYVNVISLGWGKYQMGILISALITFLVVILILYLINMLPLDGRAKQICRVIVIILGVISLLKYIAVF